MQKEPAIRRATSSCHPRTRYPRSWRPPWRSGGAPQPRRRQVAAHLREPREPAGGDHPKERRKPPPPEHRGRRGARSAARACQPRLELAARPIRARQGESGGARRHVLRGGARGGELPSSRRSSTRLSEKHSFNRTWHHSAPRWAVCGPPRRSAWKRSAAGGGGGEGASGGEAAEAAAVEEREFTIEAQAGMLQQMSGELERAEGSRDEQAQQGCARGEGA